MKQLMESGVVILDYMKSELNLTDNLTKPLNRSSNFRLCEVKLEFG